jgi:hypothetical protein
MWVGWTRPKIMAVVKGLERIPLIGIAGGFVEGYIPLVDDYFYCEFPSLVSIVSADSQIRPDKRRTDDLYIECVDDIYTAALFTLHKPLLQPPTGQLILTKEP